MQNENMYKNSNTLKHPAIEFIEALFAKEDLILVRPIETWTEGNKKMSLVDQNKANYIEASEFESHLGYLLKSSETMLTNLFFGVCPRHGVNGKYDQAWQIRKVFVIWADIDNCTVEQAWKRCKDAKLPEPSIIVNSGHGVHLYWLLTEPVIFGDGTPPLAVTTEWTQDENGKNVSKKYIKIDGESVNLKTLNSDDLLCPKAKHFQELNAGVSKAIGGDHTHDLSRLMRLPGTMNRKDQRNGVEPIPCELVKCDAELRYPLSTFEKYLEAPDKKTAKPDVKPVTKTGQPLVDLPDQIDDLIDECAAAKLGERSIKDFALCCRAVELGVAADSLWQNIQSTGKFAERGRNYFDLTWNKATQAVNTNGLITDLKAAQSLIPQTKPVLKITLTKKTLGETFNAITNILIGSGRCFNFEGRLVEASANGLRTIVDQKQFMGLLSELCEIKFFTSTGRSSYKPLPGELSSTWMENKVEIQKLPPLKQYTSTPLYDLNFKLLQPGYNIGSQVFYAGCSVTPQKTLKKLTMLLKEFCFKSETDKTNFVGMLLTGLLSPHFVGTTPGVLFEANQPLLGKSTLAQVLATIRDGETVGTATFNKNDEEFEKRLAASVLTGNSTIIIDNAKTKSRKDKIESATLERSITDSVVSFRWIGTLKLVRAENHFMFCITANAPDVGCDLLTRVVVVSLHFDGDPLTRQFKRNDPERFALENRDLILGELIGMIDRWIKAGKPRDEVKTRFNKKGWGDIIGGILKLNGFKGFLSNATTAALKFDSDTQDIVELLCKMLAAEKSKKWTATELLELAENNSLFDDALYGKLEHGKATVMGTVLSRFIEKELPVNDLGKATLVFTECDGKKRYSVKVKKVTKKKQS